MQNARLSIGQGFLSVARQLEAIRHTADGHDPLHCTGNAHATLFQSMWKHDREIAVHGTNVGYYIYRLALQKGEDEKTARTLAQATDLHDIGKIVTPASVWNTDGPISNAVKISHTVKGAAILMHCLKGRFACLAGNIALYHHERCNGKGYHGKTKDEIPLEARMATVCDFFDAATTDRPDGKAETPQWALAKMRRLQGPHRSSPQFFDPEILECFESIAEDSYDRLHPNNHCPRVEVA